MQRVARFEKVSKEQFLKGCPQADEDVYEKLILPTRATSGSAGYDFHMPYPLSLEPNESALIPTGIRVRMEEGWVLQLFPRSGLGFKYRLQLNNTVGIIDADYYFSDNEGHIFCKVTNDSREGKKIVLQRGEAFCQGIFLPFGITFDDRANGVRNGGFGSTDKK